MSRQLSVASWAVLAFLVYTSACHAAVLAPQGVHTERLEEALLEGESAEVVQRLILPKLLLAMLYTPAVLQ